MFITAPPHIVAMRSKYKNRKNYAKKCNNIVDITKKFIPLHRETCPWGVWLSLLDGCRGVWILRIWCNW